MGTGSPPAVVGCVLAMLAVANTAPRTMVPSNKLSDFFIIFPSCDKQVTCTVTGASYLDATISMEGEIPNAFVWENSVSQLRRL
jgi:hypothetical protein